MILSVDVKEATFNYGDKLYRIESERQKEFKEPCKICDDEGKITYRDFTFNCPFCGNFHNQRNGISVKKFVIVEYFIHKITIEGETLKKNFQADAIFDNPPRVQYSAFTRNGNGYNDVRTATVYTGEYIDPEPEVYITRYSDRGFFTDKKKARATLEIMQERERERFEAFCKENGRDYEFPF